MPLKKLRNLANLNKHSPNAFSNTAKTLKRKWKAANGKENPANNAPDTHLDSMSDTPSAENLEGLITDPRKIDVPEGTPWDDRKPPTQVMALEAYEAIQLLLFIPSVPGKRKRTVPKKINGWERRHLEQISSHLSLYTDKDSRTRGQWTESSVQAAVSHGAGKGGRHGRARGIRERARKYIFEREVPVCVFTLFFQC
ncbi:hypothetical protein R3P38DRAFT_2772068 [Favolaschia claudopus]|uniref:Uncharacterized protein n=1 Tax=Favolaschia claudopus TaxID=2862362 RepID=A0AAW0C9U2_9AGAR